MTLRYGSVCSGIEAATVAAHPLGWRAQWFAEIEPFPCAVLAHHYPAVPNLGDMTRIGDDAAPIELLVGGTPCQSFSVAGLRAGLDDPRGQLVFGFLRLAERFRPRWVVWENVPGVLSSVGHEAPDARPPADDLDRDDGPRDGEEVVVEDGYDADEDNAFACFLSGLQELGYGCAYRVLDAQFFGVPQRRRRVFVVGYLGDWRRAAAVLFERHSLSGNPAPSREAQADVAGTVDAGSGVRRGSGVNPGTITAGCLNFGGGNGGFRTEPGEHLIASALTRGLGSGGADAARAQANWLVAEGCDGRDRAAGHDASHANAGAPPAVAFQCQGSNVGPMGTLRNGNGNETGGVPFVFSNSGGNTGLGLSKPGVPPVTGSKGNPGNAVVGMAVRRLTPRECARLQGFPDDYLDIAFRGKPAADGPKYRALGNSMAVPVMRWIFGRIQMVENMTTATSSPAAPAVSGWDADGPLTPPAATSGPDTLLTDILIPANAEPFHAAGIRTISDAADACVARNEEWCGLLNGLQSKGGSVGAMTACVAKELERRERLMADAEKPKRPRKPKAGAVTEETPAGTFPAVKAKEPPPEDAAPPAQLEAGDKKADPDRGSWPLEEAFRDSWVAGREEAAAVRDQRAAAERLVAAQKRRRAAMDRIEELIARGEQ